MSNTVLQIKRSTANAAPDSLASGELAYSGKASSNSLFIGHPDGATGVIRIAGGKYPYLHQSSNTPGTVVANAVVITDANTFVSNVYTTGLVIGSSVGTITANATVSVINKIASFANTTQLGGTSTGSNSELTTSWAIKTYVDGQIVQHGVNTDAQYAFTNTITFGATVNFGNSSVNSAINSTAFSGTANNSTNFGGLSLAEVQGNAASNAASAYSNAATYADQQAGNAYSNATTYSSNANNISSGTIGNSYLPTNINIASIQTGNDSNYSVSNAISISITDPDNSTTINTTSIVIGNTGTYANISGGDISISGNFSGNNLTLSGNLHILGAVTSVNTTNLIVKDNFIQMADQNDTSAADIVDFGWYGVANTANVTTYYGSGRVATTNTITFFATTDDPSANNNGLGAITPMAIAAGSLTLTSPLAANSGGTGKSSYVAGDFLYASNTSALGVVSIGANGTILQVDDSGNIAWGGLDGGVF
jgi:hypothetical protein